MDTAVATIMRGWAIAERGDPDAGLGVLREGLEALTAIGQRLGQEFYHCLLADVYARAGQVDEALRALANGEEACPRQLSSRSGTLVRRAELLRRHRAPAADVEAAYQNALTTAQRLNARSFELRAATGYARWLREGDPTAARRVLGEVLGAFTEGFDTRDVCDAVDLFAELNLDSGAAGLPGLGASRHQTL
jgi:predicted ATPase